MKNLLFMGIRQSVIAMLFVSTTIAMAAPKGAETELESINLSGVVLTNANFKGAVMRGSDMSFANLRGARMTKAVLNYSTFAYANLSGAAMNQAMLLGVDLTGANIIRANLTDAALIGDLTGADLREAREPIAGYYPHLTFKNTIWIEGSVVNFEMDSADDFLHVNEGSKIAAVINDVDATVAVGNVTVDDGAKLAIKNSTLVFDMTKLGNRGAFHIGEHSSVEFDTVSELVFDFGNKALSDNDKFLIISGALSSEYIGYDKVTISVIGSKLNGFKKALYIDDGCLYLGEELFVVPEPSIALLALAGIGLLVRRRRSR